MEIIEVFGVELSGESLRPLFGELRKSIVFDRSIYGQEPFDKIIADPALHIVTWEKNYSHRSIATLHLTAAHPPARRKLIEELLEQKSQNGQIIPDGSGRRV